MKKKQKVKTTATPAIEIATAPEPDGPNENGTSAV